jgi:hypothetical protein
LTQNKSCEAFTEPNKFARPAEIEVFENYVVFHGYQEYTLTRDDLQVSKIDSVLKRKQELLASYFCLKYLAHRTLLDLGANSGFFSFWAIQMGAKKAIVLDMDEKYVQMIKEAKSRLDFGNIEVEKTNIMYWDHPADVVIALALIHWIYSCTAFYGSLDKTMQKLRQLTGYMLIVEWVAKEDPAINFFHHIDWNNKIIVQEYNIKNFENALGNHFANFKIIGDISPTRRLYVAFCAFNEIDLSGPLPHIADKDSIISSRCLTEFKGVEYWSVIYDDKNKITKQATLDLADREKHFLLQLEGEYFPQLIDSRSEETYSVIHIEKIEGEKLRLVQKEIASSAEKFRSFINSCLDILNALEKKGIIHRDIRPDNIIIRNSKPVLIDFGWAVSDDHPYFTPEGLGDLYRPEDGSFDDVYSMGMIFKEVNSGRYPEMDLVIDLMIDADASMRIKDIKTLKICFDCVFEKCQCSEEIEQQ